MCGRSQNDTGYNAIAKIYLGGNMINLIKCKSTRLLWRVMLLSFFMGALGIKQFQNLAQADNEIDSNPYRVEFDEGDLNYPYGTYRELEIHLSGGTISSDILWQNIEGELPPGLILENASGRSIRIFGAGKFVDRWCFTLAASNNNNNNNNFLAFRELCLNGTENKALDYPRATRKGILPNAEVGKVYRERLVFKDKKDYTYTGNITQQSLPKGITVEFQAKNHRFLVAGTPKEKGVFKFTTKLADNLGNVVSQQYQFEVLPKVVRTPDPDPLPDPQPQPQPIYQCPAGYYYSPTLGYCVEDRSTSCPAGSYYDAYKNSCEYYHTEPSCGSNYYYDYFLERCVQKEYPRCPWNYEYSDYYGRCVRQSYTCSFGYYYDWSRQECRRSHNSNSCNNDSYWDRQYNRCEPQWNGCSSGYRWDYDSHRCVRRWDSCRPGEYYDSIYGGCTRRTENCEPGSRYNYGSGHCEYNNSPRRCPSGQHWSYQTESCVNDNVNQPPPPRPNCEDVAQTPVACSQYAGQYGIPANATQGNASWTKNSCTGAIKYTGGCSAPAPRCEEVPQTPVSCAQYAGQFGIPANATQGNASWTKNSCNGEIKYTGGCTVPSDNPNPPQCRDVAQTPVACSDYAGQYGIPANATQGKARWTKNSCSGEIKYTGGCTVPSDTPNPPQCREVAQTPVACSEYAGQYGIPANATQGKAKWTKNSCSGEIKYTGGCTVPTDNPNPPPQCRDVAQTPVACSDYAGQYGIPANATQGKAKWTKNSCSGEIKYTGGCTVPTDNPNPPPQCRDVAQSPVACSDYAGQYGIPSNATEGRASWTKNSCTGDIRYTGGCRVPAAPRCEDEPQSPVSCSQYAGSYGIPSNATEGYASWTKNSCSGAIRYTGGCSVPAGPRCEDEPQSPVSCADYAGSYGIPAGATHGSASWTKNSCTGAIRYTGGCY
jgi:hypothetical protein